MKPITDKQRLDWLSDRVNNWNDPTMKPGLVHQIEFCTVNSVQCRLTLRAAIDAAIRAEKARKK